MTSLEKEHDRTRQGYIPPAIRLLVMDVDGTLTDGRLFIGPEGEVCKAFDVKGEFVEWLWREGRYGEKDGTKAAFLSFPV